MFGYSQCGNTDFELGDFTGWAGKLGSCCPINLTTNGLGGTRQVIMTQGIDPHSCGGLRTVYQGMYSARLGNDSFKIINVFSSYPLKSLAETSPETY